MNLRVRLRRRAGMSREGHATACVAFIGSAGIPNRYGGFEAFLEHCSPMIARQVGSVIVTCDSRVYADRIPEFRGVRRVFIAVPANGGWSILHDLVAFLAVFRQATHIAVLGVSGGLWFPFFRLLCSSTGKILAVNVDGVEWRRSKFSRSKRMLLRLFDGVAQLSAHRIIYDNAALRPFILPSCREKATEIAYPGDHVLRLPGVGFAAGTALTVCRIEPENNLDMLIEGALRSSLRRYAVVGNWSASAYGRALRARWEAEPRLELIEATYDPRRLAELREGCQFYLHGHSVGGTNPSLVEMLFYDCAVLCYDCVFNRETAGSAARYFTDASSLAALLDAGGPPPVGNVLERRRRFSGDIIAAAYLETLCGPLSRTRV